MRKYVIEVGPIQTEGAATKIGKIFERYFHGTDVESEVIPRENVGNCARITLKTDRIFHSSDVEALAYKRDPQGFYEEILGPDLQYLNFCFYLIG
jgi:hypothetical protein